MNNNKIQDLATSVEKPDIKSLSHKELEKFIREASQPAFRVKQIEEWLWVKHAQSFDEMTNLSKFLREEIEASFTLYTPRELVKQISKDGSRKYLLELADGVSVECVGMPSKNKLAVCVSTQAGCGMGCAFCATGAAGLTRSLKAYEIYDQVAFVERDFGQSVSSVVLMGQGEPFANYDESLKALRLLNSKSGMNIGARHLTVSTCGLIPQIAKFAKEPEQFTLAISLHSAIQEKRNELMPGVKKYSLAHLHDVMQEYTTKTGRRPTYEYAMIQGINDTEPDLEALCEFCKQTLCHVNLIPLNEVSGSRFQPSSEKKMQLFVKRLADVGVEATIRNSRGSDIDAACGQLKQLTK